MKFWKIVSFLIAGVLLFLVFLHFVGFQSLLSTFAQVNSSLYLLAVGLIIVSIVFWAVRWNVYVDSRGYTVGLFDLLKLTLIGIAINNLTPLARMGGEPVRAYLLSSKHGVDFEDSVASVMADGSTFLITHLLFIVVGFIAVLSIMSPPRWIVTILALSCISVLSLLFGLVFGIYSGRDYIIRFLRYITNKFDRLKEHREGIVERYEKFRASFKECLSDKKNLSKVFLVAGLSRALNIIAYFLMFLAVGHYLPIPVLIAVLGIVAMANVLPITPGSLGVYEGVFISAFALVGVPISISAVVVLLQRLVWYWGTSILGVSLGAYYGVDRFGV